MLLGVDDGLGRVSRAGKEDVLDGAAPSCPRAVRGYFYGEHGLDGAAAPGLRSDDFAFH